MKLYEYDAALAECWDEETGEILDAERLEMLDLERDQKIDSICSYIKDLQADAAAIKAEKQTLPARQAQAEKKAESLKRYLAGYLDGQRWESARNKISWRKSEQLIIDDLRVVIEGGREDILVYSEPTVNKTAAKELLKKGEEIPGLHLQEVQNLQLK